MKLKEIKPGEIVINGQTEAVMVAGEVWSLLRQQEELTRDLHKEIESLMLLLGDEEYVEIESFGKKYKVSFTEDKRLIVARGNDGQFMKYGEPFLITARA